MYKYSVHVYFLYYKPLVDYEAYILWKVQSIIHIVYRERNPCGSILYYMYSSEENKRTIVIFSLLSNPHTFKLNIIIYICYIYIYIFRICLPI